MIFAWNSSRCQCSSKRNGLNFLILLNNQLPYECRTKSRLPLPSYECRKWRIGETCGGYVRRRRNTENHCWEAGTETEIVRRSWTSFWASIAVGLLLAYIWFSHSYCSLWSCPRALQVSKFVRKCGLERRSLYRSLILHLRGRSLRAVYELQEAGFSNVYHFTGGFNTWMHEDLPTDGEGYWR